MKLPVPRGHYDQRVEMTRNGILEREDGQNHKRGRDVELGDGDLILTAPNGTRYRMTIDNSGNWVATAI